MVYGHFLGDNSEISPIMRSYGTVSSFSTRLDMLKEASAAYFAKYPGIRAEECADLWDSARNFSVRRNEIAHGIVQPYYVGGLAPTGFALGPSRHATRKKKLFRIEETSSHSVISSYAYTYNELAYFRSRFEILGLQTSRLWRHLHTEQYRRQQASL
jgi:hypothetical protein